MKSHIETGKDTSNFPITISVIVFRRGGNWCFISVRFFLTATAAVSLSSNRVKRPMADTKRKEEFHPARLVKKIQ